MYKSCDLKLTMRAYSMAAGVAESGTVLTMSASTGDSFASWIPHRFLTEYTIWPAAQSVFMNTHYTPLPHGVHHLACSTVSIHEHTLHKPTQFSPYSWTHTTHISRFSSCSWTHTRQTNTIQSLFMHTAQTNTNQSLFMNTCYTNLHNSAPVHEHMPHKPIQSCAYLWTHATQTNTIQSLFMNTH